MAPVCVLMLRPDPQVISQLTAIFLLCGFGWLALYVSRAAWQELRGQWQVKQDARRDDWRASHRGAHGSLWK